MSRSCSSAIFRDPSIAPGTGASKNVRQLVRVLRSGKLVGAFASWQGIGVNELISAALADCTPDLVVLVHEDHADRVQALCAAHHALRDLHVVVYPSASVSRSAVALECERYATGVALANTLTALGYTVRAGF